jgi:hypothetical protein
MRADVDEDSACLVEDEMLERMATLLHLSGVRERSPAAGKALDDRFDRASRICRQRIEPEDSFRGRCIDLLVRTNRQSERIFNAGHGFLYPLAFNGMWVEHEQPAIRVTPSLPCQKSRIARGPAPARSTAEILADLLRLRQVLRKIPSSYLFGFSETTEFRYHIAPIRLRSRSACSVLRGPANSQQQRQ